jgi:hypothetical protein
MFLDDIRLLHTISEERSFNKSWSSLTDDISVPSEFSFTSRPRPCDRQREKIRMLVNECHPSSRRYEDYFKRNIDSLSFPSHIMVEYLGLKRSKYFTSVPVTSIYMHKSDDINTPFAILYSDIIWNKGKIAEDLESVMSKTLSYPLDFVGRNGRQYRIIALTTDEEGHSVSFVEFDNGWHLYDDGNYKYILIKTPNMDNLSSRSISIDNIDNLIYSTYPHKDIMPKNVTGAIYVVT